MTLAADGSARPPMDSLTAVSRVVDVFDLLDRDTSVATSLLWLEIFALRLCRAGVDGRPAPRFAGVDLEVTRLLEHAAPLPLLAVRVRVEVVAGSAPVAVVVQWLLRDGVRTPVAIWLAPLIFPLVLVSTIELPLT